MDEVIKVRRSFLNELRGFCNQFASMCDGCCMRPCRCGYEATIRRAKLLVGAIDGMRNAEEERYYVNNPVDERFARVVKAIGQAGRPLHSNEILLDGVSKSLKLWTLKRMCRLHILGSSVDEAGRYVFFIDKGLSRPQSSTNNKQGTMQWHST